MDDFALLTRASNIIRVDSIMLGAVHVCGDTYNEIMETICSREELHFDVFIFEGNFESSYDES